jgi:hypothetical protein
LIAMPGRTVLYLAAPLVLLGLWTLAFVIWGDDGSRRTGARVEVRAPTVVEEPVRVAPVEPIALDPALQELLKPVLDSRREWMESMAAERKEMIKHAFGMLDELEQALADEENAAGSKPVPPSP